MTTTSSSIIKTLLILYLVIAGLHYAKAFLMPLAIGGVLATLFLPFCKWLEEKKIPKGLAAFASILVLLLIILGIGGMLAWLISDLTTDVEVLKEKILQTGDRMQDYIFNHLGIPIVKQTEIMNDQQQLVTVFLSTMAGSLMSIFTNFILILAYIFFLLYYRNHIRNFIILLAPAEQKKEMAHVVYKVTLVSQQYLVGLTKMIGCLWIMYGIGFTFIGVKNSLFFAILCGLLEIVPFIGNITGTTVTLLVSAVQGASMTMLLGIAFTYGIVQFIQGWVLEPIILGPQVKINPLFTIVALVIGELVWGIPGIFLAIPLIAMFKIVCDHVDSLKPYGFLIGEIGIRKKGISSLKKLINWLKK